jgi:predicted Ser/Thr protein kinase
VSDDPLAKTATAASTPTVADGAIATGVTGRVLGRYRIEGELGIGGMGAVYAAFDSELERRVALKLLLRAGSAESRARLLREARALAKLSHPNVVSVYEVGTHDGNDYVAMELVDGTNLADWLRAERRDTKQIVAVFAAAARGLAAAHAQGLVHRDFKPHNVLRSKSGRVLVTDFGLARAVERGDTVEDAPLPNTLTTLTATGSWVGTPAYMAPEQWTGGEVGPATDQFAFCVALWEAFVGERPFHADNVDDLRATVERGPKSLALDKIPRRFRPLFLRGLDPDPNKRYGDMEMVANLLESHAKSLAWVWWVTAATVVLGMMFGAYKACREQEELSRASITVLDPWIKEIQRFSDGSVKAPRETIHRTIVELKAGETARLVPTEQDGKPLGLKVFTLRPGTFLDAIGLANGDVIVAINGQPVTSEAELAAVLDKARTLELTIQLQREKAPFTIHVRDRELP